MNINRNEIIICRAALLDLRDKLIRKGIVPTALIPDTIEKLEKELLYMYNIEVPK